jgi:hypothetical protein
MAVRIEGNVTAQGFNGDCEFLAVYGKHDEFRMAGRSGGRDEGGVLALRRQYCCYQCE